MSLEQAMTMFGTEVAKLNATLERMSASGGLIAPGAAPPAATNGAATAEAAAPKKGRPPTVKAAQPTLEEAMAAAFEVRDTISKAAAQALIKAAGAESLGKLDPKKFTAFIASCKAELEADAAKKAGGGEPEDDEPADDEL
jgi:hypothetical protein